MGGLGVAPQAVSHCLLVYLAAAAVLISRHFCELSSDLAEAWRVFDFKFSLLSWIPLFRCSRPALNRGHQWRETSSAKTAVPFLVSWPSGSSGRRPDEAFIYCDGALLSATISRC